VCARPREGLAPARTPPRALAEEEHDGGIANDWLADGGSEGDLMRLMGWHDRAMVDRYAADMQEQRAFEAKWRRGDLCQRVLPIGLDVR
jgi:hypothetical protein